LSLACGLSLEHDFASAILDQSLVHLRAVPPSESIPLLEQLRRATKDELALAKRAQAYYSAPALLRGRLARTRFAALRAQYRRGRNETFRELYRGEVDFVKRLRAVVERFYAPLKASKTISEADARMIFGAFEGLLALHQEILAVFARTMAQSWPVVNGLGEAILGISSKMRIYGDYVRGTPAAVDACQRLQKKNTKFADFLSSVSAGLEGRLNEIQLVELLPCALNRIAQYEISFQQMADATEAAVHSRDEFESITKAAAFLHSLNEVVHMSFEMSHNHLKVAQTMNALGSPKGLAGTAPERAFVGEWDVSIVTKRVSKKVRARKLFLFSDVAVFSKPRSGAGGGSEHSRTPGSQRSGSALYRPKEIVELKEAKLDPEAHDSLVEVPANQCFAISSTSSGSCLVVLESRAAREHIIRELDKLLYGSRTTTMVFGSDLQQLIRREGFGNVPFVVEVLCELLERRIGTEGLFRASPNAKEAAELRALFDSGWHGNPSTLEKYSAHSAANVLKAYFGDLPEPLIPFSMYDEMVALAAEDDESQRAAKLGQVLNSKSMPLVHRSLLRYLMVFLYRVASHASINLMSEHNLAVVFAPNILRPRLQTVETILNMQNAIRVVETMISATQLWTEGRSGSFSV
jgi:hypothetical protein